MKKSLKKCGPRIADILQRRGTNFLFFGIPPQKVTPLYKSVSSFLKIFKIYVYEFKLKFLLYIIEEFLSTSVV